MRYYLNSNDKEVKIGDTIPIEADVDTPFGQTVATVYITVTKDNLGRLIHHEIIRKKEELTPSLLSRLIAEKLGFNIAETEVLLKTMLDAGMAAPALNMLFKAASDYLTPDIKVVKSLPKVYTISLIDGRIHEIQTTDIGTYDHFAYFVSKTQAKQVRNMFKDLLSTLYGE